MAKEAEVPPTRWCVLRVRHDATPKRLCNEEITWRSHEPPPPPLDPILDQVTPVPTVLISFSDQIYRVLIVAIKILDLY
jgi:hypothetical protein